MFTIDSQQVQLCAPDALAPLAELLAQLLAQRHGLLVNRSPLPRDSGPAIVLGLSDAADIHPSCNQQGFHLEVGRDRAIVTGASPAGALLGATALLQLFAQARNSPDIQVEHQKVGLGAI